ncbi:MAG: hypothetical protein NT107_02860 [Planctomycetota bacterium]|nr:hypothetical protein [Planctomycetota bacterium]
MLEGYSSTNLDVRVMSESGLLLPGTLLLNGIEILPIEITGRYLSQELVAGKAHLGNINGFARVELPNGGRVFAYRRLSANAWGFLHVPADGNAKVLIELAGSGATGTDNPFVDRIGVAANGLHAVIPLRAGGLYIIRLDGNVFATTNSATRFVPTASPPIPASVMVGRACVFYETSLPPTLWRMPLADGSAATSHTPPLAPTDTLRPGIAMSGDGERIVFLAGPRDLWTLYLLAETGNYRHLPAPPGKYEEPGYLPEDSGNSSLLLNQDGSRLFYLDSLVSDELFLLDTRSVLPTLQITNDVTFEPTIGVHILPMFIGTTLMIAIGATEADANLLDWFQIKLNANGGSTVNITNTGSTLPPFGAGTVHPIQGAIIGGKLLTTNINGARLLLRSINPLTAIGQTLLTDLLVPLVAGSATNGATPDLIANGASSSLLTGISGSLKATLPTGITLSPPASGPNYSATFVQLASNLGIVALYSSDGSVLAGPLLASASQIVQTKTGMIIVEAAENTQAFAPQAIVTLPAATTPIRKFISGAGG